ncbi:hypothetical protein Tco_1022049 [Tanacetum coccineum]
MLSFNLLIKSGLVMPCMNPEILMHFETPLSCMLSALNRSMKASIDFPSFASYGRFPQADQCRVEHVAPGGHDPSLNFCRCLEDFKVIFRIPVPSYVLTLVSMRVLFRTAKLQICAVNGSVSSHNHGWDKSSSSVDLCFFDLEFHCPPRSCSFSERQVSSVRADCLRFARSVASHSLSISL